MSRLKREHAALLVLAALGLLIGADLKTSPAVDLFRAPPPLALYSGQAASGGHCAVPLR